MKKIKKCNCHEYPAAFGTYGWVCGNCGRENFCKNGGIDIYNCCPLAPHPKFRSKKHAIEWVLQIENKGR